MGKIKQLVKSTSVIAFGRICTQAISFFLLPLYTTKLNTAEYGTIDIVNTISSLLLPIVSLQIQQGLFRELLEVREDTEKKKKDNFYVYYRFACSILGFFYCFVYCIHYYEQ